MILGRELLRLSQFFVISRENHVFQFFARLRVQGMRDIFEFAVTRLAARHSNEKPIRTVDDFDVMYDETIIDRDGSYGSRLEKGKRNCGIINAVFVSQAN